MKGTDILYSKFTTLLGKTNTQHELCFFETRTKLCIICILYIILWTIWHDAPHKHCQYTHKIFSFVLKYKYFDKILKYHEQLGFMYSLEKQIWQSLARIKSVYGVHMYWQPQSQLVRSNRAYACQNYYLCNNCGFNKILSHRYNFGTAVIIKKKIYIRHINSKIENILILHEIVLIH